MKEAGVVVWFDAPDADNRAQSNVGCDDMCSLSGQITANISTSCSLWDMHYGRLVKCPHSMATSLICDMNITISVWKQIHPWQLFLALIKIAFVVSTEIHVGLLYLRKVTVFRGCYVWPFNSHSFYAIEGYMQTGAQSVSKHHGKVQAICTHSVFFQQLTMSSCHRVIG